MRTLMVVLLGAISTARGIERPAAVGDLSGWLAFPVRSASTTTVEAWPWSSATRRSPRAAPVRPKTRPSSLPACTFS
jgi:hypothetical protein